MRTTVDIDEPLLRQARARAALDGARMQDVVNQALRLYLGLEMPDLQEAPLPDRITVESCGRFRFPTIQSPEPGTAMANVEMLKSADCEEDQERHASVFRR